MGEQWEMSCTLNCLLYTQQNWPTFYVWIWTCAMLSNTVTIFKLQLFILCDDDDDEDQYKQHEEFAYYSKNSHIYTQELHWRFKEKKKY